MTSSSGNTPPPTPRNPLSTPPPPPRKPRRGVRKRRRPPRESPRESRTTTPPCIICHRKRPLRTSGLCWSLECALQAAQQGSPRNRTTNSEAIQHDTTDKLSQPFFLETQPTDTPLFVGQGENVSATPRAQPQLPSGGENSVREEGEQIDRRSLEEEIERQEKDVDRGESPVARDGSHVGDSEKGDESGQSDSDDKEGIGT